jgi:glutamate formiminotransferase / formiminotetrahydrofolate cyclodeaminase
VSALMGALGVGLGAMVGWLTYGRRKYDHLDERVRADLPPLVQLQEDLLRAVDRDTDAFADFMAAMALPRGTDAEKARRREAMQEGLKKATLVPFGTMELIDAAWAPMLELARYGQFSSRSDLEVGAKALEAGLYGSYRNVVINLNDIEDDQFSQDLESRARALLERGEGMLNEIQEVVAGRAGDV